MKIHVLPGDALAEDFKNSGIEGEIVVCRECLVEGPVKAVNLETFWDVRAGFIAESYDGSRENYFLNVAGEFKKLQNLASADAEIYLWFEYELFCQTNMWFCLYLLSKSESEIFRVAPVIREKADIWKGFGCLKAEDLQKCLAARVEFSAGDIVLGANLWKAYQNADYQMLARLSETESECFPHLSEVVRAEIEKNSRPQKVLRKIMAAGKSEFGEIFPEFSKRAGVYGFGDAQVKRILQEI